MKEQLDQIQSEALAEVPGLNDQASLDAFRIKYLGKKGALTAASAGMRDVPKEEKPAIGQKLNEVRTAITAAIDEKSAALIAAEDAKSAGEIDVTLPGRSFPKGSLHPLADSRSRHANLAAHGLRARQRSRDRDRVALLRCPEHARGTPGAQRERHLLFRQWQTVAHAHF